MTDITIDQLGFKISLPFYPSRRQVLYVEDVYNAEINEFLQNNYADVCANFSQAGYEFCYFPYISRRLSDSEFVRYFTPYRRDGEIDQPLDSTCLRPFVKRGQKLKPSLIVFDNNNSRGYWFNAIRLDGTHALSEVLEAVYTYLKETKEEPKNRRYCRSEEIISLDDPADYADENFSEEVTDLIADVAEKIERLRQIGVNEMVLRSLLNPQIKLSRLRITLKGQILLPGYNNLEIKMSPLVKAVYFLFLRHDEGIVFKSLPDYRQELYNIYIRLTNRESSEAVRRSIIDVTDPCKNSINEKCARIREAFIREFDDRLANYYYVTGYRGCAKCIRLPRHLVDWDIYPKKALIDY